MSDLEERSDKHDLGDRYIWDRAKRASPSLHFGKHDKKDVLTGDNVRDRIAAATTMQTFSMDELTRVVFLDEATVNWEFTPPHYIANSETPEYICISYYILYY
jgi:hypothetical protein